MSTRQTTKTTVILLALVLLTAAAVQPAEAMEKPKISNTRTASCLVKITSDPAVLPLSDIIIDYLLHSSGVAGKAAREVLDISPDQAPDLFIIEDVAKYSAELPRPSPATTAAARRATAARTPTSRTAARRAAPARTPTTSSRRPPTTPPRSPTSTFFSERSTTRSTIPTASTTSTAEQTYLLKLQVGLGEEVLDEPIKPAAEEFMNALIENLRRALSDAFDDHRNKIRGQQDLASEEAIRAENKLVQMQQQLRSISDYRDLSRSVILTDISGLRSSIQSTEMRKASDQIEMESIGKEIADTEVKIREKVKYDPITNELEGLLKLQLQQLERTKKLHITEKATQVDIADAEEKLARARIELAKRREEISKAEGGNRVSQLSSKLAQYTQRMAQYELSLSSTKDQLKEAMDFLDRTDNYELLSLKADIARQSLQETLLWGEQMDRKARLVQPPAVTVLGGS